MAVLCVPVDRLPEVARSLAPGLAPDAVVTDVGSVKRRVVEELEEFLPAGRFVGSHPMCGSEASGMAAARADLYEGAVCVVTPTPRSSPAAVAGVEALWAMVGGRALVMDPARHDRAAALASHLPHVAAALLVELVAEGAPEAGLLCAGGFRDSTRIAAGPADLWTAILEANREEVARSLGLAAARLGELKELIESGDFASLRSFLDDAARRRAEIVAKN
jgi:prephenate dehydrogenase